MTYVEGFLTPVPSAARDAYRAHAERAAPLLKAFGVARIVESWGEDVPRGTLNDLWGAVAAEEGEAVVFSWFEYPDRAARDATNAKIMSDPRMEALMADMPFDARRMVYGGFDGVHETGSLGGAGFIDGVLMPIRGGRAAYADHAALLAPVFLDHGAVRVVDALADDVQPGVVTDFPRAVRLEGEEAVGFGWVEWPDKAARDAGWNAIMADPRMADAAPPPWDGKRMIFGGFSVILDR
ncbi:hypothetical protein GCM10011380_16860 [Sphingomonas metalli]|uniref:DUF1428 domain-containing protein n=1 Tax=Sphingomonas metalli TaxID=1779358 RepID=A0A916T2D0_9SPHN|nr:DUF1428 domain-containing protein [Sphingomonas metalli]GGB27872.1 hypothetical protein GCM10011380_16860 [Sphingomonas metalli]